MKPFMRQSARLACALLLVSCALPGVAGRRIQDQSFLLPEERAVLEGKTFAIATYRPALHARFDDSSFWSSGINPAIGIAGARADGAASVGEFGSLDPTPVAKTLLTDLLRDGFGMRPLAEAHLDLNDKPRYLAARYPQADYVLSVNTGGTLHGEWLTGKGGRASVGMTLRLVKVATQKEVAYFSCAEMTKERDTDPTLAELESDGGRRIRDVLNVLAASCARKFASQRLRAPDEALNAFPKWNQDPFAPWTPPATETGS